MPIVLDFADATVPVEELDSAAVISPHSGRTLAVVQGEVFAVGEENHEKLLHLVDRLGSHGIPSLDDHGQPGQKWQVRRQQYSYAGGEHGPNIRYRHTLELTEYEDLTPSRLILDQLSVTPYVYSEKIDDDGCLEIDARVRLDAENARALTDLLRNEEPYFNVVREGINAHPVRMRFGKVWWSQHEEETKYDLHLVAERWDELRGDRGRLFEDQAKAQWALAHYIGVIRGLGDLLKDKGIVTPEELDGIEEKATARRWERHHWFSQVDDIDDR